MKKVRSRIYAPLLIAWVLLSCGVFSGCGVLTWREVYSSKSPSRRAEIKVEEKTVRSVRLCHENRRWNLVAFIRIGA